jgi:hypothetical protein
VLERGHKARAWNVATAGVLERASKRECAELIRILRAFPLRARKRHDFEIWARAVDRWAASPYDASGFHAQMARDAATLRDVRRYVNLPPPALR